MRLAKFWPGWLFFFFLFGGCSPAASQPVLDPQAMVATIAAATVAALPTNTPQPTWTASASATLARATATPISTNTPAPTIPMLSSPTPLMILPGPGTLVAGTILPGSGSGLGTNLIFWTDVPNVYNCNPITVDPDYAQIYTPRYDFKARWRVFNSGTARWKADDIVFYFVGGDKMHNDLNRADGEFIPIGVYKGDKVLLQIGMTSPKEPGQYSATWGLRRNKSDTPFCTFSVTIRVEKK